MTDREKILHELDHQVADADWCDNDWKDNVPIWMLRGVLAILRKQEVGKWIKLTGMAPPEYHGHKICSVCESLAPYDPIHPWREMLSPYCPACGAKMYVSVSE